MKKVFGVGVGPGDKELITLKAYRVINEAKYIFVPQSKGESLAGSIVSEYTAEKEIVYLDFPMGEENGARYAEAAGRIKSILSDGETGVFITLGDPMTYSTYIYLMIELQKLCVDVETIPGITSFNASFARVNIPLTLKGDNFYLCDGQIDDEILKRADSVCILKVNRNKKEIIEKLENNGFKYTYVKRCTQMDEKILLSRDEILEDNDYMSLIIGRRS